MPFIRNVLLLTYLWICYFNICIQSLSSSVSINNAQASIFFSVQMQKGLTLISEKPDYTSFRNAVALKLFPPKEESVFDFFLYSCCCCFFPWTPAVWFACDLCGRSLKNPTWRFSSHLTRGTQWRSPSTPQRLAPSTLPFPTPNTSPSRWMRTRNVGWSSR